MALDLNVVGLDPGVDGLTIEPPISLPLRRWLSLYGGDIEDRRRNRADVLLASAEPVGVTVDPDVPYVSLGGGAGIDTGHAEVASMTRLMVMRTTGALNNSATRPVFYDGSAGGAPGSAAAVYLNDGLEDANSDASIRVQSYFDVSGTPTLVNSNLVTTVANIQAWGLYAFVFESGVGLRSYDLTRGLSGQANSANPRVVNLDHMTRIGLPGTISQSGTFQCPLEAEFEGAATEEQLAALHVFISGMLVSKITGL